MPSTGGQYWFSVLLEFVFIIVCIIAHTFNKLQVAYFAFIGPRRWAVAGIGSTSCLNLCYWAIVLPAASIPQYPLAGLAVNKQSISDDVKMMT